MPLPLVATHIAHGAGAWAAAAISAVGSAVDLEPVNSSTAITALAGITHSGTMTVTAITALPVYRLMLMAVRNEGGAFSAANYS